MVPGGAGRGKGESGGLPTVGSRTVNGEKWLGRAEKELLRRMHDVSWLMKTIKQRFAASFNASRERFGPVWSERFKSVLVEGDLKALRTVAAYIDLNAVRSGQAEDPKDYRFCGYAEALAGGKEARRGLGVLGCGLAGYRQTLFGSGDAPKEGKASLDPRQARKVIDEDRGKLPLHQLLRCRLRYLTDGYVLGSEEFVKEAAKPLGGPPQEAGPSQARRAPRRSRGLPGNARTAGGGGLREQAAQSSKFRPELA